MFSLGPWSGQIPTRFHVSRGTRVSQAPSQLTFIYRTHHLLWRAVPGPSISDLVCHLARAPNRPPLKSHNPRFATRSGLTQTAFRLFPVRSPLLRESHSVFFSSGYLDVSILRVSLSDLAIRVPPYDRRRVAPFGNLRVKACLRLSEAYRSLPRPSSPPRAKSSAISPWSLDHRILLGVSVLRPRKGTDSEYCMRCDLNLCSCQRAKIEAFLETAGIEPAASCLQSRRSPS